MPRTGRPSRGRKGVKRLLPVGLVVLAAGAVVAVIALLFATRGDERGPSSADSGVSHVHGLGINPADGSLIVATHNGSFRLPAGGDAQRIGASFQDTMGFTVAGPDHFLGSGHPDVQGMEAGQPGRLGLIESNDAGATWSNLSLGGEVDFHALAFAHDLVYGWDSGSGRFMVSADQRTWESRSTVALFGFAVDPGGPEHIVGVGPDGLIDSPDGGRTWTATDGPQLVAVSWDRTAGLWGVDPGGIVWKHDGTSWDRTGSLPGAPQALLATSDALFAAAAADVTGIYVSIDDGRTWQVRYRDSGP